MVHQPFFLASSLLLPRDFTGSFLSHTSVWFLNQAILCLSVTAPPCPHPIVSGIDAVSGNSAPGPAVPYQPNRRRGAAAVLSLVGGAR